MAFLSTLRAGDFNIKFKIRASIYTVSSYGDKTLSYSTVKEVWGIKNVSSLRNINEKYEGDRLESYGEFYILVRYDTAFVEDLDADWILEEVGPGQKYYILSYIIDPRKEYIEFRTKHYTETIA